MTQETQYSWAAQIHQLAPFCCKQRFNPIYIFLFVWKLEYAAGLDTIPAAPESRAGKPPEPYPPRREIFSRVFTQPR